MGIGYNFRRLNCSEIEKLRKNEKYKVEIKDSIDIDKAWEAIIYLLNNGNLSQKPFISIITAPHIIRQDKFTGLSQLAYLKPKDIKEIHEKLRTISDELLRKRFDPVNMTNKNIYPGTWNQEAWEYIQYNLAKLRKIFMAAYEERDCISIHWG